MDFLSSGPVWAPGAVMHHDSGANFGAIQIVSLCVYLLPPSLIFFFPFLMLSFLRIYFLTDLIPDLSIYFFQNWPVLEATKPRFSFLAYFML